MTWSTHSHNRSVPSKLQQACFRRDNYQCVRCGHQGHKGDGTLHADHKHNRAAGGQHHLNNLETLCTNCHNEKTELERTAGIQARKARLQLPPEPHPGLLPPGG